MQSVLVNSVKERDKLIRKALIEERVKNIFLEAGAGAGKSTLMVDRIVHQIVSGAQKIDQIVAITFTEKAATELQEKIEKELNKIVKVLEEESENLTLIEEIKTKRHLLFVGTIHAFCQKIIQERPIESGVPVAFTMVEEEVEKTKRQQFYYKKINEADNELQQLLSTLNEFDITIADLLKLFLQKITNQSVGIHEEKYLIKGNLQILKEDIKCKKSLIEERIIGQLRPISLLDITKSVYKKGTDLNVYKVLQAIALNESFISSTSIYTLYKNQVDNFVSQMKSQGISDLYKILTELLTEKFDCDGIEKSLSEIFTSMTRQDKLNNPFEIIQMFRNEVEEKGGLKFVKGLKSTLYKGKEITNQNLFNQIEKVKHLSDIQPLVEQLQKVFEGSYDEKIINIINQQKSYLVGNQKVYQIQNALSKLEGEFVEKRYLDAVEDVSLFKEKINTWLRNYLNFEAAEDLNSCIQNLLNDWAQQYLQQNLINGELTFDDLLYKAYIVLQDEEARQLFSSKYRHVYVDEVQDTDLLQMKILFLLTATSHPSSWATAETSLNSLFLVGDPKQSIYRFRNADLRIYDQIKRTAIESDNWRVEQLTVNFRSTEGVTKWFNDTFEPKFDLQQDTAVQPNYQQMNAFITEEDLDALPTKIETGVNFYHVNKGEYDKEVDSEAHEIVKWIYANNGQLQIVDRDKNKQLITRDMKYSDVLIIMPKRTNMEVYIRALQEAGIPTAFSGRIEIAGYKVIQRLIAITHYVAKPFKDTLFAAVAICENITLTDIYEIQNKNAYEELLEEPLFKKYVDLVDVAKSMSPLSFIEYLIYHKTSLVLGESTSKLQYKTSMSLLTTFLEKIRPLQFVSLRQMSNEFRTMIASNYSLEYEMSVEKDEDAVRVMNLHKSKGLEAAVVFLVADSDSREEKLTSYIERNEDKEDQAIYSLYKNNYGNTTIVYSPESLKPYEQELHAHAEAEEIRKLYVAATRAKQLLYVGLYNDAAKKADKNQNFYALFNKELNEAFNWEDIELNEVNYDATLFKVEDLLENYARVTLMDTSPTYEEISPSTLDNSEINKDQTENNDANSQESNLSQNMKSQVFSSYVWGNIVHAMFELYVKDLNNYTPDVRFEMSDKNFMPNYSTDEKFFTKAITRGLKQCELTIGELADLGIIEEIGHNRNARLKQIIQNEAIRNALKETIDNCIKNEKLNGFLYDGESELYTELPFKAKNIQLDEINEAENISDVYMSGIIDLVVVEDNKVTVIDYKTNALKPNENIEDFKKRLRNKYAAQLNVYKHAVSQIFNCKTVDVYLYATGIDELLEC